MAMELHILLADDNLINQKVLQKMLKLLGHPSDLASNGIEVLQALEHQHYDIVFMDIQMPEMDGLEATRKIRDHRPKHPCIIAVTAYADVFTKEKCFEAGIDEYLTKHLRLEDLKSAISKVVAIEYTSS